jgi:hypothetical protein
MTRIFYVVFVGDLEIAACLDAIRLLAEGSLKHSAHITLMGPYATPRSDFSKMSERLRGETVRIYSNGTFFYDAQNTVFLKAECTAFRTLWDKPDISDFVPHLTVYDGGSRRYATEIAASLYQAGIDLTFQANGLGQIESGTRKKGVDVLRLLPTEMLSLIIGREFTQSLIVSSSHSVRLFCIRRLLTHLSQLNDAPSKRASQAVVS